MSVGGNGLPVVIFVLAGCVSTPTAGDPEDQTCEQIGTASDAAASFAKSGQPIIISGDVAMLCPCQTRRLGVASERRQLAGATEERRLAGASEKRHVGGASEERQLASASEKRSVGGASEERQLASASEKRSVNGATEERRLGGASEVRKAFSCVPSAGCSGYVVPGDGDLRIVDQRGERVLANRCVP